MADFVDRWAVATTRELARDPFQRDPAFLERLLPLMNLFARYFDAEVRGMDALPAAGPMLLVGNHSGGMLTPDTSALYAAWYRTRGLESPLFGVAFDAAFSIPGLSTLMRKIGQLPASQANAARALASGASVLVYPGGVHDVYRPHRDRNRIDFNGRTGFIKLALRARVPVVAVVGHGGHETLVVLSRGEALARMLRLERLRVGISPILLQMPWGLSTPAMPGMPLPAKITMQVGVPMPWSHLGPEDADDPVVVARCHDEIRDQMQATLTSLAAEHPHPLLSRLRGLAGGRR